MKNFLIRFFVSLCIFLLTGYGQLYAQLYLSYQQTPSIEQSESVAQNHADDAQSTNRFFNKHVSISAENPNCQFTIPLFETEEDDDLSAFKKQLKNVLFSSVIASYIPAGVISPAKSAVHPGTLFSQPAPSRYLVLQVFRI